MIACEGYVFLTPAKTGSTSLENYLTKNFPHTMINNKHDIHVPTEFQNYKKILLVRNPYDWFISHYYWSNTNNDILTYAKEFLKKVSGVMPYVSKSFYEEEPVSPQEGRLINKKQARLANDPQITKNHIAFELQMYKPLSLCAQTVKPYHIMKLETIVEDLKYLGFNVDSFPHDNQSTNRPKEPLESFYTKELLYIVGPFLAQEAKALGYPVLEV